MEATKINAIWNFNKYDLLSSKVFKYKYIAIL